MTSMIYKEGAAKTLASADECKRRFDLLNKPHILPLTTFVNKIRQKLCPWHVPYFDPCDGGINAQCLFVFESPGAKAVVSGFISRDNPDETAKNFFDLNKDVGLQRNKTVIWNIVPWYIGMGQKITSKNRQEGLEYLKELISPSLLSKLKVVVLVGKEAQRIKGDIDSKRFEILECCHPSPKALNTDGTRRDDIRGCLEKVKTII